MSLWGRSRVAGNGPVIRINDGFEKTHTIYDLRYSIYARQELRAVLAGLLICPPQTRHDFIAIYDLRYTIYARQELRATIVS
ncbi:MAG: hypothetical protein WCS94_02395 [Verrucomicrobiota bacterium]